MSTPPPSHVALPTTEAQAIHNRLLAERMRLAAELAEVDRHLAALTRAEPVHLADAPGDDPGGGEPLEVTDPDQIRAAIEQLKAQVGDKPGPQVVDVEATDAAS